MALPGNSVLGGSAGHGSRLVALVVVVVGQHEHGQTTADRYKAGEGRRHEGGIIEG